MDSFLLFYVEVDVRFVSWELFSLLESGFKSLSYLVLSKSATAILIVTVRIYLLSPIAILQKTLLLLQCLFGLKMLCDTAPCSFLYKRGPLH